MTTDLFGIRLSCVVTIFHLWKSAAKFLLLWLMVCNASSQIIDVYAPTLNASASSATNVSSFTSSWQSDRWLEYTYAPTEKIRIQNTGVSGQGVQDSQGGWDAVNGLINPVPDNPSWLYDGWVYNTSPTVPEQNPQKKVYKLEYYYENVVGNTSGQYTIDFTKPLPAFSKLIFVDFEWQNERMSLQFYDTSGSLIPFGAFSLSAHNGDAVNQSWQYYSWQDSPGNSGVLSGTLAATNGLNDPVISLETPISISKAVYTFDLNTTRVTASATQPAGSLYRTVAFGFVAPVPEPSTAALVFAALAILAPLIVATKARR